jgi:hypothetical protein
MVEQLDELLLKLSVQMPAYTKARTEKTNAHIEFREHLKKACELLRNSTDAMMFILSEKYAHNYGLYKILRKVVYVGRKRKAYGGRFKDKQTGKVLEDVQMSVVDTAEKLVNDFANKVTVVIEKAGYKKLVLKDVNMLTLNALNCELEPEGQVVLPEGDGFRCFE